MIRLIQKQKIIISHYLEGLTQRQIAKELGISRQTVATYIKEYELARKELLIAGKKYDSKELIDKIVEEPKYNSQNREKRKLTQEIIAKIEECLKENEYKRQIGQHKQQKKIIDIYEALRKEGYDISYGTVRSATNTLHNKPKEAFIKADYQPGDVCEFDWGDVKLFIQENLRTLQLAVFTSARGNYRYARLYARQDTPCFNETHALFFQHINGVYKTMVYDNSRVAVKRFVGINEKEPTEALLKLSIYYGFRFRFCNIYAGNEKGHVERSVEYVRRKAFAFKDRFSSIEEANDYLQEICIQLNSKEQVYNGNKTANQILAEEKPWLLPGMPLFDTARTENLRVDKYSTITVDTCHYSVPDVYVRKKVFAKVYSDKILCYYDGQKICEHTKKSTQNEWSVKIEHYVDTLRKKPGALASSTALHQANPKLQQIYKKYYIKKEKEFIELLQLLKESSFEKIEKVITVLEKISPNDITTEKIRALLYISNQIKLKEVSTSEINKKSKEMLDRFKCLIPASDKNITGEAVGS